jgi:hypothetical protein
MLYNNEFAIMMKEKKYIPLIVMIVIFFNGVYSNARYKRLADKI